MRIKPRLPYRVTRDLHLHAGLFISPFVLLYAASVVLLNHAWEPRHPRVVKERSIPIHVTNQENSVELAKQIRRQLGVGGEIGFVRRNEARQQISFPLEMPGQRTTVRVNLATGIAEIERMETSAGEAVNYLHKMPGPHNVAIRGNWIFMRLWSWLADATVYLILFVSATGVYLWSVIKAERRAGLMLLGAGVVCFFLALFAVMA